MRAAPAVSCAKLCKNGAHEHTGSAEAVRHPLRNGFTAYFVLSPVERACCHRHFTENFPQSLAPASRRQDHTTSPYALAFRPAKKPPDAKASITSRAPRVVTIMIRPSCGRETGRVIILISRIVKRNIFCFGGLTPFLTIRSDLPDVSFH